MNNVWGSTAQYEVISWPWPIAVYLFLAGLSAGAIMIALVVKWTRNKDEQNNNWDAVIKAGALIAPVSIIIGTIFLVFDLGKPWAFFLLLISYNVTSVMTLGALVLSLYVPVTIIFMMLIFDDYIRKIKLFAIVMPIIDFIKNSKKYSRIIEFILFTIAAVIGVYTGFLLSALQSVPMWNTPILPILFLVSGISAGIAANILVALFCFKNSINKDSIQYLLLLDLIAILIEIGLLVVLFVGMMYDAGASLIAAKQALTTGIWAKIFWICVVGIGLLLPILIAFTALKNHAYKVGYIILNSLIVLLGGIMLRFYIVYAGQLFTGV